MQCRPWKHLVLLPVVLLSFSCARLPEKPENQVHDVAIHMLEDEETIPMEWGRLVAVSNSPTWKDTRLWFQDEEGTVRMVNYNNVTSLIKPRVRVLRRK